MPPSKQIVDSTPTPAVPKSRAKKQIVDSEPEIPTRTKKNSSAVSVASHDSATKQPKAPKPTKTAEPVTEVPPVVKPVPKPRAKKVAPAADGGSDPVPEEPAATRRRTRGASEGGAVRLPARSRVPLSPRTAAAAFSVSEVVSSYREAQRNTRALANSHRVLTKLHAKCAEANGKDFEFSGKTYSRADVDECDRKFRAAITRIPLVTKQAGLRKKPLLDEEACSARLAVKKERARKGADTLALALDIPGLASALFSKAEESLDEEAKKKAGKGAKAPRPTENFFYVSDQFVKFVETENFGNGAALLFSGLTLDAHRVDGAADPAAAIRVVEKELGFDICKKLGITREQAELLANPQNILRQIIQTGIATQPLLMMIMARYARVNGLIDDHSRVRVNTAMKDAFGVGNTRWIHNGEDYTPADIAEECEKSGLQRLSEEPSRESKRGGAPTIPFDGEYFAFQMSIKLASYYRISVIPVEEYAAVLKDPTLEIVAEGVRIFMKSSFAK